MVVRIPIGGYLLAIGPWPVIFWFLAAFGLVIGLATFFVLPETLPVEHRVPLHVGALLRSVWIVGSDGAFARLAIATALIFATQFLYIAAAPIFVVDLLGKGERDFWIFFFPMIGGLMLGSWLTACRLATGETTEIAGIRPVSINCSTSEVIPSLR